MLELFFNIENSLFRRKIFNIKLKKNKQSGHRNCQNTKTVTGLRASPGSNSSSPWPDVLPTRVTQYTPAAKLPIGPMLQKPIHGWAPPALGERWGKLTSLPSARGKLNQCSRKLYSIKSHYFKYAFSKAQFQAPLSLNEAEVLVKPRF